MIIGKASFALPTWTAPARAAGSDVYQPGAPPETGAITRAMLTELMKPVDSLLVAWKGKVPDNVRTNPTFAGDQVLFPTSHGLAVLDAKTGVRGPDLLSGDCSTRPTTGPDGAIYLAASSLHRIENGQVAWTRGEPRREAAPPLPLEDGGALSPQRELTRFDAAGNAGWSYPAEASGTMVRSGNLVFVPDDEGVHAVDLTTGQGRRIVDVTPADVAVTARGDLLVTDMSSQLHCFSPEGERRWLWSGQLERTVAPEEAPDCSNAFIRSAPQFSPDGQTIYLGGRGGELFALDLEGNLKWKKELKDDMDMSGDALQVASDGTIYASAQYGAGDVAALSPQGDVLWTYQNYSPDGTTFLAVRDDLVVFTTRMGDVVALKQDALQERVLEAAQKPDDAPSAISVGNGVVTIGGVRVKQKRR